MEVGNPGWHLMPQAETPLVLAQPALPASVFFVLAVFTIEVLGAALEQQDLSPVS